MTKSPILFLAMVLTAMPAAQSLGAADHAARTFSVAELSKAKVRKVVAKPSTEGGESLRVTLRPGLAESEMYDKPTFVVVPTKFKNGVIEVDIMSRVVPDAPEMSRGFVGIAYHISLNADRFESVYLRPANGSSLNPPAPRDKRAVQWFSYPVWPFSRLRREFPAGPYEAGADIAPGRWMHLRLEIRDRHVVATVDGKTVLDVESREAPSSGAVGLWVDIGSEGFFKNLTIRPAS